MDDQLDDDLKKRIREVFDDFEDTSADEGWLLLREKFPEKAKRRPVAWLWWGGSVAALLMLFLGVLLFKYKTGGDQQQLTGGQKHSAINLAPKTAEPQKENTIKDSSALANASITHTQTKIDSSNVGKNGGNKTNTDNIASATKASKNTINRTNKKQLLPLQPGGQNNNTNASLAKNSPALNRSAVAGQTKSQNPNGTTPDNGSSTNQSYVANQPKTQDHKVVTPNNTNSTTQPFAAVQSKIQGQNQELTEVVNLAKSNAQQTKKVAATPGVNMLEQTNKTNKTLFSIDEPVKPSEKTNRDKKVLFGVYAATYFNYAKGSSNQLNVGAGVTSDIRLSNNLKLSTGVAIAQNTLNYQNQPPVNSPLAAQVAVTAAPSPNYFSLAASSVYTVASPSFKSYNASLVGLDVPLNLKYEFSPQKSSTYILAGLSSGTFINESYTYSYTNQNAFTTKAGQQQDQSTRQNFNSFYFAKTLNFAFGTGYSLGGNKLIIEPFVKYPLDGLGAQQLKFGAGGLNLKFNFSK